MNKLSGTSGQLFSVLTEAVKSGGAVRSGKNSGGQATTNASFHDLSTRCRTREAGHERSGN